MGETLEPAHADSLRCCCRGPELTLTLPHLPGLHEGPGPPPQRPRPGFRSENTLPVCDPCTTLPRAPLLTPTAASCLSLSVSQGCFTAAAPPSPAAAGNERGGLAWTPTSKNVSVGPETSRARAL